MPGLQLDLLEDEAIDERKQKGMLLITCGALWLGIDLLIVMVIGTTGLRAGSSLWTIWTLVEAVVGLVSIGIGVHLRGTLYR
jgi:hypothetical protein